MTQERKTDVTTRRSYSVPARSVDVPGYGVVAYREYGDPSGRPVFALHGIPACSAGFAWSDEPARDRAIRVVAPDRPGVGLSSLDSPWRVADDPARLAAFADAMGMARFGVWGYSGGGPYAVAAACVLGERLTGVAVAAGMGQIGEWARADDFEKTDRQLLDLAVRRPRRAKAILRVTGMVTRHAPKLALSSFRKQVSPADASVLEALGTPSEVLALMTEALVNGPDGVVADYAALAQPWGCDLQRATGPVRVFHGDADPMVPLAHSRALVERLPNASLTVWPGEGHLAAITHVGEILDALIK